VITAQPAYDFCNSIQRPIGPVFSLCLFSPDTVRKNSGVSPLQFPLLSR